ncbi:VanW family protein [Tsukamurella soli]|uniref:VanW family protein n=1 Tax=Tsukamurella soli TaxID=644556 RepID=A0ABP8KDH1_9ACTN
MATVAVLVGAGGAAVWTSGNDRTVPGAVAAGVDIGGMTRAAAERRLADRTMFAQHGPVTLRTPDGTVELPPAELGLTVDVPATVDRAIAARTPWRSLLGVLGGTTTVPASGSIDRTVFDGAVQRSAATLTHAMVDGAVVFQAGRPVAVEPETGIGIDLGAAAAAVAARWPGAGTIDVPVRQAQPTVTAATVAATLRGPAAAAVASDVSVTGGRTTAHITPADIGTFLSYRPDGHGGLAPQVDRPALLTVVHKEVGAVAIKAKDAGFDLAGAAPTVVPGTPGRALDVEPTADAVAAAVGATGAHRTVAGVFGATRPRVTTALAESLGIKEVVGEFTTGGFAGDSGVNIRRIARQVNGAVVLPGETFSLNGYTGTRGAAQGYVEAGIINHGRPDRAVGGGISQFATTLYNAAYFAGLADAGHTEHSYYISRYPPAREATVYDGTIDLRFRNDTPYGVVIQAVADSSTVTVRIWSTKTRDVRSITGPRSAVTQPGTVRVSGAHCIPATGRPGFTVSDTRVITDAKTGGQISRETHTVTYDPEPTVVCAK